MTFALGTAVGDLVASSAGLGFLVGGLLFLAGIAGVVVARGLRILGPVASFWAAYVLTRPARRSPTGSRWRPRAAASAPGPDSSRRSSRSSSWRPCPHSPPVSAGGSGPAGRPPSGPDPSRCAQRGTRRSGRPTGGAVRAGTAPPVRQALRLVGRRRFRRERLPTLRDLHRDGDRDRGEGDRPQPRPVEHVPRRVVERDRPGPPSANIAAEKPRNAGNSKPPSALKKPLGVWTLDATPIVVAAPAPAIGVARPRASAAPEPASPRPARTALRRPGRKPIWCMPWAVPSMPPPPKAPNSFWEPCETRTAPRAIRSRVLAVTEAVVVRELMRSP